MPGTPTSRGLVTLATSDVITSFATTINTVTSSVDTALSNTLQFYNYVVANAAARNALTGMVDGSLCFQTDNNELWYYDYNGGVSAQWRLWSRPKTAYTASIGSAGGSTAASTTGSYAVSNGICYVEVDYPVTSTTNLFVGSATITGASGNGTTATYTFASHPFIVGQQITVSGITSPTGLNGTFIITSATATSVTVANTTSGTGSLAGATAVTSNAAISMPIPYANFKGTQFQQIAGNAAFFNASNSQSHLGQAMWLTASTVAPMYQGTRGQLTNPATATGNPLTEAWAVGDRIQLSMAYPI